MATVSAFPTEDNGGPKINKYTQFPPDYNTTVYRFDDGGARANVNPCGPMRFLLEYEGLDESQAAVLDAHLDLAKAGVNDFSFTSPRDGITYTGVKYLNYGRGQHQKYWVQSRTITLYVED